MAQCATLFASYVLRCARHTMIPRCDTGMTRMAPSRHPGYECAGQPSDDAGRCRDDPMTVSKLKVLDGTQLTYELRGRVGDAPPVVLIHSLGMDRTFWNAVTPVLAQATAVLLY